MYRVDRRGMPRTKLASVSGCIYKGPCLVTALSISGTAATPDAQLYDGENSNGEQKADLRVVQDESFSPNLDGGVFCERGIYLTIDATTTYVMVTYYPAVPCEDEA